MEVSTLMTLALFLNPFPVFGLDLPFTWLAVFLIPFSWHWLGVPDLMGFYKQDILWKVKRKNMTWALWEFSIKIVFWCSRCWWNRQTHYFSTHIIDFPISSCWMLVLCFCFSISIRHTCLSNRCWHEIFFSAWHFICASYVFYSSGHIGLLTIGMHVHLFTTRVWNFFTILAYSGRCVQHNNKQCVEECFFA